jgi:hypothetical protein
VVRAARSYSRTKPRHDLDVAGAVNGIDRTVDLADVTSVGRMMATGGNLRELVAFLRTVRSEKL